MVKPSESSRRSRRLRVGVFLLILAGGLLTLWERYRGWKESSQDAFILAAASRYQVHPALIKAVVWRESGFDPNARGSKGELGLMQLMPGTADEWARAERVALHFERQMLDPSMNTRAGTWYLRKVSQRYKNTDNPLPYALADYNAGRANVLKWAKGAAATNSAAFIQAIGFPSTRDYVVRVSERYLRYRETFPPKSKR